MPFDPLLAETTGVAPGEPNTVEPVAIGEVETRPFTIWKTRNTSFGHQKYRYPCQYAGVLYSPCPANAFGIDSTICWFPDALKWPMSFRFTTYSVPSLPAPTARYGCAAPLKYGSSIAPPEPKSRSSELSSNSLYGVK